MWYKININLQNIELNTGKVVLIKMPKVSKYGGYKFWHPSKLVRENGGKGYHFTFSFTEEFEFKLLQYGNGKYNKFDVVDEIKVSYSEILEAFENGDVSISEANEKHAKKEFKEQFITKEITVHTPAKIDSNIEVKIDEELKR